MCNLFKVSNKETKLRQWRCSGVFIINFEHVSHIILLFSLLSLNKFITGGVECFLIQSWYRKIKNKIKFRVFEYFMSSKKDSN